MCFGFVCEENKKIKKICYSNIAPKCNFLIAGIFTVWNVRKILGENQVFSKTPYIKNFSYWIKIVVLSIT